MDRLKPCPFCGSKKVGGMMRLGSCFIRCNKCCASVPDPNATRVSMEEAWKLWNSRTERMAKYERN